MPGSETTKSVTAVSLGRSYFWLSFALLFLFSTEARAQGPTATITGFVQDASGTAIAGASVRLQMGNGVTIQTTSADSRGAYLLAGLTQGTYKLSASMSGYSDVSSDSFSLRAAETKHFNLTLALLQGSQSDPSKHKSLPEFSDEPNFTVAGVADTTNLGGHGSDVVVRNRESLAKETSSLGSESQGAAQPSMAATATENFLRTAVERNAANYDANYQLGKLLVEEGRAHEAIPYLEHALRIKPDAYESEYELALAHCVTGEYDVAAAQARVLLARQDKAELHHLLGEIEEKSNNPLEAVRQYQRAAELDPSESNYFEWGTELLLHQAAEPALEVFGKGSRLFPSSIRMLSALGTAWYVRGSYDQAVQILCRASDLDPNSAAPYLFLGRIQSVENSENQDAVTRLARFARLQPANAWANYYYAVSLWKQRRGPDDNHNLRQIESLLQTAVRVDPKLTGAYLQLGILYAEQKNSAAAIAAYQKAAETSPDLPDAHYRLAQAYRQAGEKLKAEQELQLYQQTSKHAAEEVERERHEVRQFVYTLRDQTSAPRPH
jgi:tetratricopeptide (TPR) repeat protein